MSLIARIVTRRPEDIINQGARLGLTGAVSGSTVDGSIQAGISERTIVVTGFIISSNTSARVQLGFKTGANSTINFFDGYVSANCSICFNYSFGDERYSNVGDALVINTTAAAAYTVNARLIGEKVSLGYIEELGAPAHLSPAVPPVTNTPGLYRGGFPN